MIASTRLTRGQKPQIGGGRAAEAFEIQRLAQHGLQRDIAQRQSAADRQPVAVVGDHFAETVPPKPRNSLTLNTPRERSMVRLPRSASSMP